jgi:hypothetical protein
VAVDYFYPATSRRSRGATWSIFHPARTDLGFSASIFSCFDRGSSLSDSLTPLRLPNYEEVVGRPLILWLAVRPLGNVSRNPFQEEFADQIRHSICARVGQSIQED